MNFSLETSVSALTVFIQGFLSFFSPCVLPLLPLYIGYLSGGAAQTDAEGHIYYQRRKIFVRTLCFVLGISGAFFLLGFAFTAAGQFFKEYQTWFARIGGFLIILFGLYQLGLFKSRTLSTEHRLPFHADRLAVSPLTAFIFGFTFSFAWTPCIGPVLTSVLIMSSSADTAGLGFLYILVYTLGFVIPFLAAGLFTGTLLDLFRKHQSVVRYTVKIGGILLILIGILLVSGRMDNLSAALAGNTSPVGETSGASDAETSAPTADTQKRPASESGAPSENAETENSPAGTEETDVESFAESETESSTSDLPDAPSFTLTDQYGTIHTLEDYQGKTIFLNFWATWCSPCRAEMPDIQELYTDHGENTGDVIILGVASPNYGWEESQSHVDAFLTQNNYTYPVLMDEGGQLADQFGITAYPTTFMITSEGKVFGYVTGQLDKEMMNSIIDQTISGKMDP